MKILVLDDEQRIQDLVALQLESTFQSKLYKVSSIDEALEIFNSEKIDVALIDICLNQDLNGLDLLKRIQDMNKETFCIMITGNCNPQYLRRAFEEHCFDFIEKPFKKDLLLYRVGKALELKYYHNLLNLVARDYLFAKFDQWTADRYEKLPIEQRCQLLEAAIGLIEFKNYKQSGGK